MMGICSKDQWTSKPKSNVIKLVGDGDKTEINWVFGHQLYKW